MLKLIGLVELRVVELTGAVCRVWHIPGTKFCMKAPCDVKQILVDFAHSH